MSERSRRLKRPIVLLIALIIGVAAVVFTFTYLDKNMAMVKDMDKDSMEAAGKSLGISIGVALATPHMIVAAVATAACGLAWLLKLRWAAILAGVLYAIALVLMLPWFYLVIVQMILCFIGAGNLGRQKQERLIEKKLSSPQGG